MARDIPALEPTELQAGNTLAFTKSLNDFPATTWTLSYTLRPEANPQQGVDPIPAIQATASGNDFSISVAASTTAGWLPGTYWLAGYVSSGTERYEVYRARLTITADISQSNSYDGRTYWEQILDKVRKMILDGAIRDTIRYSWNGVDIQIVTMADAFKAEAYAASKVAQERSSTKQRKILIRFVSSR